MKHEINMKIKIKLVVLVFILSQLIILQLSGMSNTSKFGVMESKLFSVEVNGQKVWTEDYVSNLEFEKLPDWFIAPYVREHQRMHIASFEGEGNLEFVITLDETPKNVRLRPMDRGITPVVEENKIMFSSNKVGQLVLEVDSLPPLYLFINPKEENIPLKDDKNVIYFEPGIHEAGYIELKDNHTVYIAEGAIVYGGIRANGANNIKVIGRGILDGDYRFNNIVLLENSSNIHFEGVIIRNSISWTNTLVNCRNVNYDNVKVLGFGPSSDGINPAGSQNVTIKNCFIRCTDDCIAIKAPNPDHPIKDILVENCVLIGYAYADGVTIGFETNAEYVKDVIVRNCDILLARGGSRVDGHSGFSIICDGPATISNIIFDDIRVEESELKLFELHITDGTKYGEGPAGNIQDIIIKNIKWYHEGPIIILGHNENNRVENVTFENCTVAGRKLVDVKNKVLSLNSFTSNIEIK